MSGNLTDVLALAEAINARRSSDDKFAELLGEVSTALAEILAAMEKPESKKDEQAEADALGKAIAAALLLGAAIRPPPVIKVATAPATSTPPPNMARARAPSSWWASRRKSTLFSAKLSPPSTASTSGSRPGPGPAGALLGAGAPAWPVATPESGHSTTKAPARASNTRSPPRRLMRSLSSRRDSSTVHSGIR